MSDFKYIKEYIDTGDGTEGQLLVPRKIYDILVKEVDKRLIPRTESAMYFGPSQIPGSSIDVDLTTPDTLSLRKVAEGGELPLSAPEYSSTNLKPVKYGVAIRITEEMVEDSKFNLMKHSIQTAGKRFAENETSLILTALQSCTNNVSGGASLSVANIVRAMQYLDDNDYETTSMLIGNEALADLRQIDSFAEAEKAGNDEFQRTGFKGVIYGMMVYRFSTNAAPSSTYSKYVYVYDKNQAYMIAEKRPVTLRNFKIETFDMEGAALTQRIIVELLRDSAVCRISTS